MNDTVVDGLVPVVAQLSLPVKVGRGDDATLDHLRDHVTSVDVYCDEGAEHHPDQLGQVPTDQFGKVV